MILPKRNFCSIAFFDEFLLFCIFPHHCHKYILNLCFGQICSQFGPLFGDLEPFLAPRMPFLDHFYIGLYIRKVRFWKIPVRTKTVVESRNAIIFDSINNFDKSDAIRFKCIMFLGTTSIASQVPGKMSINLITVWQNICPESSYSKTSIRRTPSGDKKVSVL